MYSTACIEATEKRVRERDLLEMPVIVYVVTVRACVCTTERLMAKRLHMYESMEENAPVGPLYNIRRGRKSLTDGYHFEFSFSVICSL